MSLHRIALAILALPMAAFFGFVGWHKSVDSLADLARYHAWTAWLPEWLGRLVGWSELLCAGALLAALHPRGLRIAGLGAAVLIVNQLAAAGVHLAHGETAALPQNAVLIALLGLIGWIARPAARPKGAEL